jgi:Flavin containing amine oxidoreductase
MPAAACGQSANLLHSNMESWAGSGFTHRFRNASGTYHVSRTAPWDALRDCLSPLVHRYKLARGDSSSDAIREMATMSLSDWMRRSNAPADVHDIANALRGFFLADPDEILSFLAGGSASACLRDKAAGGGRSLLSDLCWFGIDRSPVTAVHIGDWTADPWARGGYAFLDPGFDPAWRSLLARRAGRIVFAGEHTSERWQGYMDGAIESGQRAARELIAQSR